MQKSLLNILLVLFAGAFTQNVAQTINLVKDIKITEARNSNPLKLAVYRDTLYFTAQPENKGSRFYKTDGTAAGTKLIGPSIGTDNVRDFFFYKNAFYFLWNDGIHGQELWVSDGTTTGTHLFLDILTGSGSSEIAYLTICNDKLFFKATDNVDFNRLFVSDGTVAGTKKLNVYAGVFNGMNEFIVFKDKVYFPGGNATIPKGLFVSDGSDAGTGLVKEGIFGTLGGNYAMLNDKMYFCAADDLHGSELWQSDGTPVNTQLFFNIATADNPGSQSNGGPHNFFMHDGNIYFAASDGVNGNELWVTNGIPAGTHMVADLIPGDGGVSPEHFILYKNEVYFLGTVGGVKAFYKTDGTLAGTKLVKAFPDLSDFYSIYIYKSLMYMALGGGLSSNVWVSDGTRSGTVKINPVINTLQTQEMNFVNYKDELYLPAYTSSTGMELFKFSDVTNGLEEISVRQALILYPNPGSGSFNLLGKRSASDIQAYDVLGNNIGIEHVEGTYHLKTSIKGIYLLHLTTESNQTELEKLEIR